VKSEYWQTGEWCRQRRRSDVPMNTEMRTLEDDPDYAAAHAYLAWGLEMRVVRGGYHKADAIAGVRHARAALAHGTDDPTALAVASLVLLHLDNDFSAASGAIRRRVRR
jgi:hypothetical protein